MAVPVIAPASILTPALTRNGSPFPGTVVGGASGRRSGIALCKPPLSGLSVTPLTAPEGAIMDFTVRHYRYHHQIADSFKYPSIALFKVFAADGRLVCVVRERLT